MFSLRNKNVISIFRMKKAPYLLLCLGEKIGSGWASASSAFSNNISSETARPIETNYMWNRHGMGEQKFVQNVI